MKSIHAALLAGASMLLMPVAAFAQDVPAAQPAIVEQTAVEAAPVAAPQPVEVVLPANSEIALSLNETVNSKTHRVGDKVAFTVVQDVKVDGRTLIPQGTRAIGQVTRRTGRGGFGKSGKMDVTFRYVEYNGQRIPIEGRHHQAGEGRTAATVGAVVAAGVIGGLVVKGKNARIDSGREFTIRTAEDIPALLPAADGAPAMIAASYTPTPVSMEIETNKERKAREKAARGAGERATR
jgi:hypothetical protein